MRATCWIPWDLSHAVTIGIGSCFGGWSGGDPPDLTGSIEGISRTLDEIRLWAGARNAVVEIRQIASIRSRMSCTQLMAPCSPQLLHAPCLPQLLQLLQLLHAPYLPQLLQLLQLLHAPCLLQVVEVVKARPASSAQRELGIAKWSKAAAQCKTLVRQLESNQSAVRVSWDRIGSRVSWNRTRVPCASAGIE